MTINRNKLYTIILTSCVVGYIWIYYGLNPINNFSFRGCLIKQLTNTPCPSCGSSRSINLIIKGAFFEAIKTNPLGYIILVILIVSPIWIIIDVITKNEKFYLFYKNIETTLKKKKYALPLILIVIFNWIWNISKGL